MIFNAIEKIEVVVRTKNVQIYYEATRDSNWYEDESIFNNDSFWANEKDESTGRIEKKKVFQYDVLMDDIASHPFVSITSLFCTKIPLISKYAVVYLKNTGV